MGLIAISGYAGSGKDTVGKIIQLLTCENNKEVSHDKIIEVLNNYDSNQWWIEEQSGWEIKKWAGKLKQIASLLTDIPVEKFEDQEFKKTYMPSEWDTYGIVRKDGHRQVAIQNVPHTSDSIWLKDDRAKQVHNRMTVREFLQKLGTDGLRDGVHPNVWVNALMSEYKLQPNSAIAEFLAAEGLPASMNGGKKEYPNWIITDTRFPNEAKAIKEVGGIVIRVDRPGIKAINTHPSETALDDWNFDYKIANASDLKALTFTVENILKEQKILTP